MSAPPYPANRPQPVTAPDQITLFVYGLPAPQGSKRHVGKGVLIDHNPEALHTWREDVKLAAIRAMRHTPEWARDYPAIVGHFTFTLPRPRSHFRVKGGQLTNVLHQWAPQLHTTRPDLDKLLRSTWDALTTAGVYADDNRLAQVWATKVYPSLKFNGDRTNGTLDRPGARIVLTGVHR